MQKLRFYLFLFLSLILVLPSANKALATNIDGELDLHDATILNNPPDLADWPITTQITGINLGANGISVDFSKKDGPDRWPDITPPGWEGPLEYTLGMAENINGKWYASAVIEYWNGLSESGGPPSLYTRNWFYAADRWGPMTCHTLKAGETIGFFVVAGDLRNNLQGNLSPVKERSNVVLVKMPTDGLPCDPNGSIPSPTPTPPVIIPRPSPTPPPTPTPPPPPGEVIPNCDPLPTDPDLLLKCNALSNEYLPQKNYNPGTDPNNPSVLPFSGIGGLAAAYSEKTDSLLVVGNNLVGSSNRQIIGIMADPKTVAPKGTPFRLDSNGTAGLPKVVYSPDLEKFLVAWEDERCSGCRSIYGRFVSANGTVEGKSDFVIHTGTALLNGLAYDAVNKKFVIAYENFGKSIAFRTVDGDGKVSSATTVVSSYAYQGQGDVAVNTNLNEYWFSYTRAENPDAPNEDGRAMVSRFSAATLKPIGDPIQLSTVRLGHNAFGQTKLAYSTSGGGANIMWLERGREGIAGMWGKTLYDDGRLSDEYPVITISTNVYSDGFSSDSIQYNPWTETFFVFSNDWNDNAWMTEIGLGGLIYSNEPALGVVTLDHNAWWNKLASLFINKAYAAAVGNFNVIGAVTPYGAVTLASRDYLHVVGTYQSSPNVPIPSPTPAQSLPSTPSKVDLKSLPKLVNQIYVWGLGVSVLLALLMMVLGGYYIMTAAGNAEQASKGKEYFTAAIIGVVIIFAAYLLLREINPDLVNFNLDSLKKL